MFKQGQIDHRSKKITVLFQGITLVYNWERMPKNQCRNSQFDHRSKKITVLF